MDKKRYCVVVTAPVNIAIVKYWGKRCTRLNLPLNSSLSVTLSQDHLKTTTKAITSPDFTDDEVWLNGVKQDIEANDRLKTCLSETKRIGRKLSISKRLNSATDLLIYSQKVHIHTENNFPTAAGLASSASGYAGLVFALASLYGMEGDLTSLARRGSGSACRSMHGGFVEWAKGEQADGGDSIGFQLFPETHWPELRVFVVVVNDKRKKVGSTGGMQRSVETSNLLAHRADGIVEHRMKAARQAICERNFPMLAEVIMKDSNQLHAICLDTYPPLRYLTDTSHEIISMVHAYNRASGSVRVAYSFDAGPNACLFTTENFIGELAWMISHFFPTDGSNGVIFRGDPVDRVPPSEDVQSILNTGERKTNLLKDVILTKVGRGPQLVYDEYCED